MNYTSSNNHNGVTICGYAKTNGSVLDDEDELLDGVDDFAHDISTCFTVTMQRFQLNHNVIYVKLNNIYFVGYVDLRDHSETCGYSQAAMWYQEKTRKNIKQANPKHSLCCSMGRIQLSFLKNPLMLLQKLLCDEKSHESKNYQQNMRAYNMMFAFSSP